MSLTSAQQVRCVFLLGYPGSCLVPGSTNYMSTIYARVTGLSSDVETLVLTLLTRVEELDTKLVNSQKRFASTAIGDIKINENERSLLRSERRSYVGELGRLLDIPLLGGGSGVRCIV